MLYNVQCLNGHATVVTPGSNMELMCKKRMAAGYLDAMPISTLQCAECIGHRRHGDQITEEDAECVAATLDPRHPNAVDRYLSGENLG